MSLTLNLTDKQVECLTNMCAAYSDARSAAGRPSSIVDSIADLLPEPEHKSTALVYAHKDDVDDLRKIANSMLALRGAG